MGEENRSDQTKDNASSGYSGLVKNGTEPEVFISYAWDGESETTVNKIDEGFRAHGIRLIRDKRDLGYKGSIQGFMERIGQANCIIVVISDKYLRSPNCMFELVEIADNKQFSDRVFPVVLSDAAIYDPVKRLGYVKYWEDKRTELAEAMHGVDPANLQGIRDDIDNYDRYRDRISGLTSLLKDMNTLTLEMHAANQFSILVDAVKDAMTSKGAAFESLERADQETHVQTKPLYEIHSTTTSGTGGRGCQVNIVIMAVVVGLVSLSALMIFSPSIRTLLSGPSSTPSPTSTLTPSPEGIITPSTTPFLAVPTCPEMSETRYGFDCGFRSWSKSQDKEMQAVTEVTSTQMLNLHKIPSTVLVIKVDFTGDSQTRKIENREQGEVEVILSDLPPKGYEYETVDDLAGRKIVAYVWASKDASGDPVHLNGLQLFLRDSQSNSCYGKWTNIEPSNEENWFRVVWEEPTDEEKIADQEQAEKDNTKPKCVPGFNINEPKILGLKIAVGTGSTKVYEEPITIYLDDVDWLTNTPVPTP